MMVSLLCLMSIQNMWAQEKPEEMYTLQGKNKFVVNERYRANNNAYGHNHETPPCKLVGTLPFTVGRYSYELKLYRCTGEGWKTEQPSDFHILRLFHADKQVLEFVDADGMSDITPGGVFDTDLRQVSAVPNKYAIICPLTNDVTALIFEGCRHGNRPPKIPVVVAKGSEAAVLLNRPLGIDNMVSANGMLEVNFVDSFREELDKDDMGNSILSEWHPNHFRLYSTPAGTLMFQQIKKVQRSDLRPVGL